jgi:hypothetical protein
VTERVPCKSTFLLMKAMTPSDRRMRVRTLSFQSATASESFCSWRRKQNKSPKTLNEYLSAIGTLLNWLESATGPNPLRHVEQMQQQFGAT